MSVSERDVAASIAHEVWAHEPPPEETLCPCCGEPTVEGLPPADQLPPPDELAERLGGCCVALHEGRQEELRSSWGDLTREVGLRPDASPREYVRRLIRCLYAHHGEEETWRAIASSSSAVEALERAVDH